jgi:hypothetical protein
MKATFLFIFLFVFSCYPASAQPGTETIGESLDELFLALRKTPGDDRRTEIGDSINMFLKEYITYDSLFNHTFYHLRYLGQVTSPDSLLKIISWNLPLSNGTGKYFSYIVRKQSSAKNLVQQLTADYNPGMILTDMHYDPENWYGALYYAIRPVVDGGARYWVILGLDYGNPFMTRKVIDVLDFNGDKLKIGKMWFETDGEQSFRKVFEYASTATMTVRFSSDTSIVFDHLVPFTPEPGEARQMLAPDFSYDAYIYKDGLWRFAANVDVRNRE